MPRLTEQQIAALTHEFYSCFVGTNVSEAPHGVSMVCTDARNEQMKGLGYNEQFIVSNPTIAWNDA